MLKKLLIIAALLTVLIIIVGGVLWIRSLVPERHSFLLSNGSVITFNQATFGTNHVMTTGGRWRKFLPRFLDRWRGPLASLNSFNTQSPSVMLWFDHSGPQGGGLDYGCTLVHADGTEVPFANHRSSMQSTPTNALIGMRSVYPQREELLRVRIYDRKSYDTSELLGEFTLRNPKVSRAPFRTAPSLPQTASDGDLTVTLESLVAGARRSQWEKTNVFQQWTRARFQILERGEPSTRWSAGAIEATDSLGIILTSNTRSSRTEKEREVLDFQPLFWPSETYQLRFEFSRNHEAEFASNELWTIRGIAVPTNGGFTLVNTQWNAGPTTVRFSGLTSIGGQPPWDKLYNGEPALGFSVFPIPKDHRFSLIRITDDRGRKVDTSGFSSSGTNYGFGLRLKDEVRSIDITMALHLSRYVKFQVRPEKWDGKVSR